MHMKMKRQKYENKRWSVFFAIRKLSLERRAKFITPIKGLKTIDISDLPFVERYVIFFVT